MKIGVDIREYLQKNGKGKYVRMLVDAIKSNDKTNQYTFYTKESIAFDEENINVVQVKAPSITWHFHVAYRTKNIEKNKIFIAPTSYIIPSLISQTIMVVHDLVAFLDKSTNQKRAQKIEQATLKRALRKTSHVITVSENTKKDLVSLLRAAEHKISVVPLTFNKEILEPISEDLAKKFPQKHNLTTPFLLFVGTIEPRKNIARIVSAYERAKKTNSSVPQLVIAGKPGWEHEEIMQKIKNSPQKESIVMTGAVSDEELRYLYQNAFILLFPSLYEGFGLPILEAFAHNVPVITSNTGSMPEVAGEAAMLVNPKNDQEIADAIIKLTADESQSEELLKNIPMQLEKFSEKAFQEKTMQVIKFYG